MKMDGGKKPVDVARLAKLKVKKLDRGRLMVNMESMWRADLLGAEIPVWYCEVKEKKIIQENWGCVRTRRKPKKRRR